MNVDLVNHPPHYESRSGVECIDVVRHLPFSLGNCVKYVWRYNEKWNPKEDLDKSLWYLEDYMVNPLSSIFVYTDPGYSEGKASSVLELILRHEMYLTEVDPMAARVFQSLHKYLRFEGSAETVDRNLKILWYDIASLREDVARTKTWGGTIG